MPTLPEVSVVIPCLNEADTLAVCIEKAQQALLENGIEGEVVVADNGSTDGSLGIAEGLGARVVNVAARGYGQALMGGFEAARGRFILMGDADDSYDFREIPRFVAKLREGFDLVQGCRLPSGGGTVLPGAMPFLHYWWGNPMFSWLARRWFGAPIRDVYCGLRGFTKALYVRLEQRCTGMEFATEMIIKATLHGARIAEVPITLHPSGRRSHGSHLRTFHDGWRTLRFFLLYSPRWLFLAPGALLVGLGLLGYALALPGVRLAGAHLDVHTLLIASLALLLGYQSILFYLSTKTFAIREGLLPEDARFERFFELVNLERGLLLGAVALLGGLVLIAVAANGWRLSGFGDLDYAHTMRWVVPGVTLTALGFQTILSGFFVSLLGDAAAVSVVDRVHGGYVHGRRVRALVSHLAAIVPRDGELVDVGCGDGLLSSLLAEARPDLEVTGLDVMARPAAHIPVSLFDGARIPRPDGGADVVLFVDVLHHTSDPMVLLREAARVARRAIVIKDHTMTGFLAGPTLRFMDWIGNARHGVELPYNYWTLKAWKDAFAELGLGVEAWVADVGLYPWPADLAFGRSLHFIARLAPPPAVSE